MDRGEEGALEKMQDDPTVRAYLDLYDPIISILSPALPDTIPPAVIHPSSRTHAFLLDTNRERAEAIKRFQRHTRCARPQIMSAQEDTAGDPRAYMARGDGGWQGHTTTTPSLFQPSSFPSHDAFPRPQSPPR
jgi:hypothetical protein